MTQGDHGIQAVSTGTMRRVNVDLQRARRAWGHSVQAVLDGPHFYIVYFPTVLWPSYKLWRRRRHTST